MHPCSATDVFVRNFRTDLIDELGEQIPIRENGRDRKITKQHAFVKALVAAAIKDDMRATNALHDIIKIPRLQWQHHFVKARRLSRASCIGDNNRVTVRHPSLGIRRFPGQVFSTRLALHDVWVVAQHEVPIPLEIDGNIGVLAKWRECHDRRKFAVSIGAKHVTVESPAHLDTARITFSHTQGAKKSFAGRLIEKDNSCCGCQRDRDQSKASRAISEIFALSMQAANK